MSQMYSVHLTHLLEREYKKSLMLLYKAFGLFNFFILLNAQSVCNFHAHRVWKGTWYPSPCIVMIPEKCDFPMAIG